MQLQHMLNEKTILLNVSGRDKWQILQLLVHCLDESTDEHDGEAVLRAVMAREHCSSTGVGGGIAIPHARTDRVPTVAVALAISREGIDFASLDGRPCHLVFLVLAPPGASTRYLDALSSIASIGVRPDDVTNLAACTSAQQVLDRLAEMNGARNPTGLQYSFLR